jgi:hypothetical protein
LQSSPARYVGPPSLSDLVTHQNHQLGAAGAPGVGSAEHAGIGIGETPLEWPRPALFLGLAIEPGGLGLGPVDDRSPEMGF